MAGAEEAQGTSRAAARRRRRAVERYGERILLMVVAVSLAAVPFGLLLVQVSTDGPFTRWDTALARELNEQVRDRPLVVDALQVVSAVGRPLTLTVLVSAGVVGLWWRGSRRLATFLAATAIGGGLLSWTVKVLVGRPRPVVDHPVATAWGRSFPSGHALGSTICFGALTLVLLPMLPRRARTPALVAVVLLVAAIGASRLALGVHYLSDVLGGFVLGLAWLAASVAAFQTWRVDRGRPRTEALDGGVEPEEVARAGGAGDHGGPAL